MRKKLRTPRQSIRPPRIRVPDNERAVFTTESGKFIGVIKRLSLTGGSAILSKGPIPYGKFAGIDLKTVYGKVQARIQFLHTGADGMPLTQAFRFLDMDDSSRERFRAAAELMQDAGFSDVEDRRNAFDVSLSKLLDSIRQLTRVITSARGRAAKE